MSMSTCSDIPFTTWWIIINNYFYTKCTVILR